MRTPVTRAAALLAMGVACVALMLVARSHAMLPGDLTITRAVQGVTAPGFHALLQPFNVLGFPPVVDMIYGAVAVLIFLFGKRLAALSCAFAGIGGAMLNFLGKTLVPRARPPVELVHVEHMIPNSSFPAGHVLNFTAFAGFLAYLVWTRVPPSWPRTLLLAAFVSMIALMGVARIDSGEHWPSDVAGGYLLGGLWLAATVGFYRLMKRRQSPIRLIGSSVRS